MSLVLIGGRAGDSSGPPPACLTLRGVSKTFGSTRVLHDIDLDVRPATVHALLGENGSGKSTLIKILAGYHSPDAGGEVSVNGIALPLGSAHAAHLAGCRFVHQDLGLIDSATVADNFAMTLGFPSRFGTVRQRELDRRTAAALDRLRLSVKPSDRVGDLPPAQRTGVAVARALEGTDRAAVSLLVLDEPTATLPAAEVADLLKVIRRVADAGVGVLYVSHHLDEVFQVADDVSVLRDGRHVITAEAQDLTRDALINHLIGRELEEVRRASEALPPEHGARVLEVDGLSCGPLQHVSLSLRPGDVIGVAGVTGSGRETLLPAIFGALRRTEGTVLVGQRHIPAGRPDRSIAARMALLPANRLTHGAITDMSARENLSLPRLADLWRFPRLSRRRELQQARQWFARLDVRPRAAVDAAMSTFSGGNQQKIILAKWLRCDPRVMLLDEPTQGVDIGAKAEIHRQILDAVASGAAALISSADYDELVALAHRILVVRSGRIIAELSGERLTVAELTRTVLGTEEAIV